MQGFVGIGRRLSLLTAAILVVFLLLVPASGAQAARGVTTGFLDDALFASTDPQVRTKWLLHAKNDGAGMVRINVPWRSVTGDTPPLTPASPNSPGYDMSRIDAAVQSADALGVDVMLTPYLAPAWAEGPNRPANFRAGTWKPDPQAFGKFGQMLAKRYSGFYLGLPRVRYFEAWNEPNLSTYLTPQWSAGKVFSPGFYRQMLNRFYEGVKAGQPGAKVIAGGTAPFGDDFGKPLIKGSPRMRPLAFLRNMFCLRDNLKPRACPTKPKLDILSHHPVNIVNAPTRPARNPDDVEIADFHKLGTLMRAAERAGTVFPAGFHPLWATEIWWYSNPPNPIGLPVMKHARYLEEGLYILWKKGARTVINYEIRDPAYDPSAPPQGQWTSGVFFNGGSKKPAFTAWRFPFVTNRTSQTTVGVWGKAPATGKLNIQRYAKGAWRTVKSLNVQTGDVFTSSIPLSGAAKLRGKIGLTNSLPWHQG